MANPTSNFGWQMPTNTDLVKDLPADFEVFGQAVDTSLMDLKGGTTGQVLSKASNTDMDFTWVAQDDSNAIQNALLTTTGDTIYASAASTPARLGIGTTGQVLTVSAGGLPTWATSAAGSLTLLSTTTLSGTSTTITGISQSYKHLQIVINNVYASAATQFACDIDNQSSGDAIGIYDNAGTYTVYGGSANTPYTMRTTASATRVVMVMTIYDYASTTLGKHYTYTGSLDASKHFAIFGNYDYTGAIDEMRFFTANGTATFSGGTVKIYGVN